MQPHPHHCSLKAQLASLFILNGNCDNRADYQSSGHWVTRWCEPEEKRWRKDSVVERLRALFISYINSGKIFNVLESQFFPFTCKMEIIIPNLQVMNVRFTAPQIWSSNTVEFPLLSITKLKHSIALRFWVGCGAPLSSNAGPEDSILSGWGRWVTLVGTWRKEELRLNPQSFLLRTVSLVSECLSLLPDRIPVIPEAMVSSGPWASVTLFLPFDSPAFRWKWLRSVADLGLSKTTQW